ARRVKTAYEFAVPAHEGGKGACDLAIRAAHVPFEHLFELAITSDETLYALLEASALRVEVFPKRPCDPRLRLPAIRIEQIAKLLKKAPTFRCDNISIDPASCLIESEQPDAERSERKVVSRAALRHTA